MNHSKLLALSALLLVSVIDAKAYSFGYNGSSGSDGRSGDSGQSGQDVEITADGTQRFFDLSGRDGSPGNSGSYGQDAWSCSQPYGIDSDVYGADGGRGGDGGYGGSGGNGGSITVYYNDVNLLRSISARATGGRGSFGGNGASGGSACRCTYPTWNVQKCENHTNPDGTVNHVCHYETHYCRDGMNGRFGGQGRNGSTGRSGEAVLIPQLEPLIPNIRSHSVTLANIETPVTLAVNQWETRSGALALFGNGTDLANNYMIFTGRKFYQASLKWAAGRNINEFSNNQVTLSVDGPNVVFEADSDIWVQSQKSMVGNTSVFTIQKIIKASEATNFSVSVRGSGNSTELVIHDASGVSEIVNSSVTLKLEADTMFDRNLFEGVVPANLLAIGENGLVIKVGSMGIKDKYLQKGKGLKAALSVGRSLGGRSANWDNKWEGKIN